MRSGGRDFYTYQYLRSQGFLPNYGFPRSSVTLTFSSREDDIRREQERSIREFAPGNYVYYAGEKFAVKEARPRTSDVGPLTKHMRVCSECEAVFMGEEAQEMAACTECGNSFEGTHSEPNAMEFPDQRAGPEEYITSDEEERRRRGYEIDRYYHREDADAYELESDNINAHLTYEPNSDIVVVNSGFKDPDKDLDGFAICDECNQWLTSEDMIDKHTGEDANCYANASQDQVKRGVKLYTRGGHDTVTLTTPVPDDVDSERSEEFYVTLKEALFQGMLVAFDMDDGEIETFVKPASEDSGAASIVFYEVSEGGAGALHTLPETHRFRQVVREALTVIHEDTGEEGCNKACYECLMSFYNQYEHHLLDRNLVKSWLESMTGVEIEEVEDTKDRDKYESLLEQCDSGFEKDVLKEVWDEGYELPDEAQHTIYDDGEPVVKPDFFYEKSGSSVAVFVDGPDHEKDYVEKDDEEKRRRLRSMGYRVVVVEDVSEVNEIWDTI
jgi:ribosomal protein L37AE/L43A